MTTVQKTEPAEGKRSYKIIVTTRRNKFKIPVIDVRDGYGERNEANYMIKKSKGGSKFLRPSFGSGGGSYQSPRITF